MPNMYKCNADLGTCELDASGTQTKAQCADSCVQNKYKCDYEDMICREQSESPPPGREWLSQVDCSRTCGKYRLMDGRCWTETQFDQDDTPRDDVYNTFEACAKAASEFYYDIPVSERAPLGDQNKCSYCAGQQSGQDGTRRVHLPAKVYGGCIKDPNNPCCQPASCNDCCTDKLGYGPMNCGRIGGQGWCLPGGNPASPA